VVNPRGYARLVDEQPVFDHLPTIDDEPAGIFWPREPHTDEAMAQLAQDCRDRGQHHFARMEIPIQGRVITCTHCYAYWLAA
jgi:hypothetical protein